MKDEEIYNIAVQPILEAILTPKAIYRNRKKYTTIVLWKDGSKTIVRKMDGKEDSPYEAFTAALAKRIFGTNSKVCRIVEMTKDQSWKTASKKVKKLAKQIKEKDRERWSF